MDEQIKTNEHTQLSFSNHSFFKSNFKAMKRIFNFALVGLLAIGAASCSKESVMDGETPVNPNTKSMTFTIPASSGIITYANDANGDVIGDVTANAAEKAIDASSIQVFMFDATTEKLQAIITNPTIATAGSNKTATIKLENTWADYDKDKHFYLVVNGTSAAAHSFVADATLTTATSLTDFLKWNTVSQGATHIKPVDGTASSYLLMTEKVENVDLETATAVDVIFRREVARFDIDNQVNTVGANTGGNVIVEEVKVYNANLQGFVFGYEQRPAMMTAPATDATNLLPAVPVTATVDAGTGKQVQASLMYLYPTKIGKDGTGTQIYLKGKVGTVSKTFTLKNSANDIVIEANKRYKISAIDALTLTFQIEVAEWDEGVDLPGTPTDDPVNFALTAAPTGAAVTTYANGLLTVKDEAGAINFTVQASSSAGTSFSLVQVGSTDHTGAYAVTETPSSTITYGTPYFASTYAISKSLMTAGEGSTTKLVITDNANPSNVIEIRLFHEGTNNEIVNVENDLGITDEALKDYLKNELGLTGDVTTDELDNVTSIDLAGRTDVESLDGIENFPNLKNLNADGLTNLTEIDLSKNPNLEEVRINDSQISVIDVTDLPNLSVLSLQNSSVSEIDLSQNPLLSQISIAGCSNITSIDVSHNQELTDLIFYNTPISEINLSNNPKLRYLNCMNTGITELNLSHTPALLSLQCSQTGITELDLSNVPELAILSCNYVPLEVLDLSANTKLREINCHHMSEIKALDFSKNLLLEKIIASYSSFKSIDLSKCTELHTLAVTSITFGTIDISNCKKLTSFTARNLTSFTVIVWQGFPGAETQFTVLNDTGNSTVTYQPMQ